MARSDTIEAPLRRLTNVVSAWTRTLAGRRAPADVAAHSVGKPRPAAPKERGAPMDGLFTYIWKNSRREQLIILAIVLASMPFYFISLDLPKSIVNDAIQGHAFAHGKTQAVLFHIELTLPHFLGGATLPISPGLTLDRLSYLLWLSFAFLALVLINGAFKWVINMQKGKLGERILQRLRLDLFSLLLRFSPEAIRNVKASETATIIKDEVEPIGAFVGDAFIQPFFLGGQALTALLFILLQSLPLGIVTAFMVAIQGVVIPRLRREQIRLGRQRQLQSRSLAGRIGEIVEGMAEVDNHGTAHYERHQIAALLEKLFWIRYTLYGRKFMVKFINNTLAQLTPFMFYAIGGYFALKGTLDIGQLVAVIAAYRDLPPPVKELIDWDQQRLDVEVKYQQVVEQFSVGELAPLGTATLPPIEQGEIETQGLRVVGSGGAVLLDGVTTSIPVGTHVALQALSGDGASTLAQVIGRRIAAYSGSVRIAGYDLASLSGDAIGPRMAYAGPEATIFYGTIRDNILYSLKRRLPQTQPRGPAFADQIEAMYHAAPHQNPLAVGADEWIDYGAAGARGPDDIDDLIIEVLRIVGMDEAIYRFGLGQAIDPARDPALAQRFVEARRALDEVLTAEQAKELIESFHPDRYNRNATIGENLVFGVARDSGLAEGNLIDHAAVRAVLDRAMLTLPLARMGLRIAEIMVEIFADVSGDNFLIEQFSFIQIGDLPAYEEIITRVRARGADEPAAADARRLVALALMYVEPRHRLGLLTQELEERIVRARADFRASMAQGGDAAIEFYDPDRYCAAAPLRDNLLFGRVTYGVPGAAERVLSTVRRVLEARGLDREIYRLGLKQQTGPGGRLLFPSQRAAIALARCLIKRPDVLILNQAMSAFGDVEGKEILRRIKARMEGRTLIVLARDSETATLFDLVVALQEGKIKSAGTPAVAAAVAQAPAPASSPQAEQDEVKALRAIPMFADIETARLKLIALASERVYFAAGQTIFRQGAVSDSAYIILEGGADAVLETPAGPIRLSHVHANSVVGEMGVINGAPRSATVVTTTETTALRLSRDVLLGLLSEFPQIALALMRDLIRRLVAANALIARASGMGEDGGAINSPAMQGGAAGEDNRA